MTTRQGGDQMVTTQADLHACDRCQCCGGCACPWNGDHPCGGYRREATQLEGRLRPLYEALHSPEPWYVQTSSSGMVHRIDCPTVTAMIARAERYIDGGCNHDDQPWYHGPTLPTPIPAAQVRPGTRCSTCAPEVLVTRRSRGVQHQLTGLGWPADDGITCVRGRLPRHLKGHKGGWLAS